jgi:hypothetical protein
MLLRSQKYGLDPGSEILVKKNTGFRILNTHWLQGREGLISWVQEVLLEACRVKMYPTSIIPESSHVPHEPIPFYCNQARQSIPLVPYNRMQDQVSQPCNFLI